MKKILMSLMLLLFVVSVEAKPFPVDYQEPPTKWEFTADYVAKHMQANQMSVTEINELTKGLYSFKIDMGDEYSDTGRVLVLGVGKWTQKLYLHVLEDMQKTGKYLHLYMYKNVLMSFPLETPEILLKKYEEVLLNLK